MRLKLVNLPLLCDVEHFYPRIRAPEEKNIRLQLAELNGGKVALGVVLCWKRKQVSDIAC